MFYSIKYIYSTLIHRSYCLIGFSLCLCLIFHCLRSSRICDCPLSFRSQVGVVRWISWEASRGKQHCQRTLPSPFLFPIWYVSPSGTRRGKGGEDERGVGRAKSLDCTRMEWTAALVGEGMGKAIYLSEWRPMALWFKRSSREFLTAFRSNVVM